MTDDRSTKDELRDQLRDRARELRRERRQARKNRHDNPWARLVFGLSILAVGVIAWLDHLHRLRAWDYLAWWPLALIALGLAHLPQRRWVGALVYVLIGIAFLPRLSFFPRFSLELVIGVWPLLISAAGVTLIMQVLRPVAKDAAGSGAFKAFALMGGSGRTISSENFLGGDAVAVMGGHDINLTNAHIVDEATIDVLVFWGGIDIRVPRGWNVETHVTALLGGFGNHTSPPTTAGAPRLIIRGSAIMGGIDVKHPKDVAS
jgi:hypothetical protein